MKTLQLVISPAAKSDLKNIFQFGLRNWGQSQSESYLENLKDHVWNLTEQPLIGIERPELLDNIRSSPVESHMLFYRVLSKQIEIVRILHGKQDPQRHIS